MTIDDLDKLTTPTITPAQVGAVLGIDPNTIRWQARDNPALLGFPVIVVKSRTYIPRVPFINFIRGTVERNTELGEYEKSVGTSQIMKGQE